MARTAEGGDRRPLTLRTKLILVVLLVGLVPLLLATGVSYHFARRDLERAAFANLIALRDAKAHHIADYYGIIESQVLSLARDESVKANATEFGQSFHELPGELGWTDADAPDARERRDAARQVVTSSNELLSLAEGLRCTVGARTRTNSSG